MCTSLLYLDAHDRAFLGRTLELSIELPYQLSFFPKKLELKSSAEGFSSISWKAQYDFLAITMPATAQASQEQYGAEGLKVVEGLNSAGLSFSVQSYPQASGSDVEIKEGAERAALLASDLGSWVLGQFSSVSEVKAALTNLEVVLDRVPILGGLKMPFHYGVHDTSGNSLVVEFHHGSRMIYDNPVGVMTNGPQFDWHLTNLNNYTFLTNIDRSTAKFGSFDAIQPGSGIAKAGLPVTDSSVDRFIRGVYYAQFAEKQVEPDKAIEMVAHIMNNFDRPRGIAIDYQDQGSSHLQVQGYASTTIPTEFTSWTSISDLDRRLFFVRDGGGMNYASFDVQELGRLSSGFTTAALSDLLPKPQNFSTALISANKS